MNQEKLSGQGGKGGMGVKLDNCSCIPFREGGVSVENEQKDVFDRALEFLGNKWLERHGIQGYVARSVHIEKDEEPAEGREEASA